jgi:hypothetical protein
MTQHFVATTLNTSIYATAGSPSAGQHPPVYLSTSAQGPGRRYTRRVCVLLDLRGTLAIRSWKVWNRVQFEQKTMSSWEFGKVRVQFTAKAGSGTSASCGNSFLVSTTERSYCRSWVCLHSKSDAKAHPTAFKQSFSFSFVLDFLLLIFFFLFPVTLAHCWTIHVYFEGLVLAPWMVRSRRWPGRTGGIQAFDCLLVLYLIFWGPEGWLGVWRKTAESIRQRAYYQERDTILQRRRVGWGRREGIWMVG